MDDFIEILIHYFSFAPPEPEHMLTHWLPAGGTFEDFDYYVKKGLLHIILYSPFDCGFNPIFAS